MTYDSFMSVCHYLVRIAGTQSVLLLLNITLYLVFNKWRMKGNILPEIEKIKLQILYKQYDETDET